MRATGARAARPARTERDLASVRGAPSRRAGWTRPAPRDHPTPRKGDRCVERELRNPPEVHVPQAHYSHVARVGQTLYLSGQLAMDGTGTPVGLGDAAAQARQCYENLSLLLVHYGGSL